MGATATGERRVVLVVDPVAANTLYLQDVLGIYKSVDLGATWSKLGTAPDFPQSRLAVDPSTSGTLYIVAQNPAAQYVSTLFTSVDFGETWTALATVPEVGISFQGNIFVDPRNSINLFLAAATSCGSALCGLLRSGDSGLTWGNLRLPGQFESVVFGPNSGDYYASGQLTGLGTVVLRSSDAGNT